jgi:hypothetical protein
MALTGTMIVSKPHAKRLTDIADRIVAKTATVADSDFLKTYARRIRQTVRSEAAGASDQWLSQAAQIRATASALDDTDSLKASMTDAATKLETAAAAAQAAAPEE